MSTAIRYPAKSGLPEMTVSCGSKRVKTVTPVATSAIQNIDAEINDAR